MGPIRVAVIGAGPAGLAALRHLVASPTKFKAVSFEKSGNIGGMWVYTEKHGEDGFEKPVHSSIYKNIRTNLPKEVMAFQDFPFRETLPSFLKHEDVRKYLEDYAAHHQLKQHVKFNTSVEKVHPKISTNGEVIWQVTTKCVRQPDSPLTCYEYDAVMVCTGHYSVPQIPDIPGLDTFRGRVMHSHDYRYPEIFENKRVIVLGAGVSGMDIILDVAKCAKQVILSHNKPLLKSPLPSNVMQSPGISSMKENAAVLLDGTEQQVDALIMCTGYLFSFPFLTPECGVSTDGGYVFPLYKQMIHTTYPSLSFIGLCTVVPFPVFNSQVKFFIATLGGSLSLPSKKEMDRDTARDLEKMVRSGLSPKYPHRLGKFRWEYLDSLANAVGHQRSPKVISKIFEAVALRRETALQDFKNDNYRVLDCETYECIEEL